jgi:TRAP-type C4-dicarboxylate transport system substrate-binding protein
MSIKKSLATILVLCAVAAGSFAQAKIQLKIASIAPSRSPWDVEQRALAQEWSTITHGEVSVMFYDTNSLGGEKGVIQKFRSVRPGMKAPLDGAIFTTIGLHELAPSASIYTLSIPFLIRNQKELDTVLDTYGSDLKADYSKAGFEMIAWTNVGWLSFYTKDKFSTLDELKKIKIASAGLDSPILGDSFRAAGFNIEDIEQAKLLQALKSSGGVRGFFGVHMYAYVTGMSKCVSYALDTKLCPVLAGLVISNEAWAKIPAQYKPAMVAAAVRMRTRLDASLDASDRKYMDMMKAEGVTAITPTAAELADWERIFARDINTVDRSAPGAFNIAMYHKIQDMLQAGRK